MSTMSVSAKKKYQFPSAPVTFCMPNGRRITIPDGVYETSDEEELKELEAAVKVGNIFHYTGKIESKSQIPPVPVDMHKPN